MNYKTAKTEADKIVELLSPHCEYISIAGSIRRKKKDGIKDVEIVCIPKHLNGKRTNAFCSAVFNVGTIRKGKLKDGKYIAIVTEGNIKLDLFIANKDNLAMTLLIRTGPADFSRNILGKFNGMGFKSVGSRPVNSSGFSPDFKTEADIFSYLSLPFIEPENRG